MHKDKDSKYQTVLRPSEIYYKE